MHLLAKLVLLIILVSVGWFIYSDKFPEIKRNVVEYINPVAKEERLVGELDGLLARMKSSATKIESEAIDLLDDPNKSEVALDDLRNFIKENADLIDQSKKIVEEIGEINSKKISAITAGIDKVGDLVDTLPFADPNSSGKIASLSFEDKQGNIYACSLVKQRQN